MNNYEAEVLLRFLFCKLKFDLDLLIGLKNAMKFKDSMPWVRFAFDNVFKGIYARSVTVRKYDLFAWFNIAIKRGKNGGIFS